LIEKFGQDEKQRRPSFPSNNHRHALPHPSLLTASSYIDLGNHFFPLLMDSLIPFTTSGIENIYIARHGFRANWVSDVWESPTGMARDPPLAAYGIVSAFPFFLLWLYEMRWGSG
jgi:hypothetical protein